jgi:hypothetical protein
MAAAGAIYHLSWRKLLWRERNVSGWLIQCNENMSILISNTISCLNEAQWLSMAILASLLAWRLWRPLMLASVAWPSMWPGQLNVSSVAACVNVAISVCVSAVARLAQLSVSCLVMYLFS